MNPIHKARAQQQKKVTTYASNSDAYAFFNLLTGPELFDAVESELPPHRERQYPPVTDRHKGATDDRRNGATWSGMKLAFRTVRRMG